jgi:arylsulfate sulfotransferase
MACIAPRDVSRYHGFMTRGYTAPLLLFTALSGAVILLYPRLRPVRISVALAEKAPLSALARIESREPGRVSLAIRGRDDNDLVVSFDTVSASHRLPVLGLYPDYDNKVEITLTTARGRVYRRTVEVKTPPLPTIFPEIRLERHLPELMAPGMTFLHLAHYDEEGNFHPLTCAVDEFGKVRWFYEGRIGHVLKRLKNGKMLIHDTDTLIEMNMLGEPTGRSWKADTGIHHDALELPDGNLLALSTAPGSFEDGMIEFDRESAEHLRYWDFREILDAGRPLQPRNLEEKDWLHLNGLSYDATRDSVVLSGRDQSAVFSIDRQTGALNWILGSHRHWSERFRGFLLQPRGGKFDWPWGQHAPMVDPADPDRLLVYDNGNKRSYDDPLEPADNYSRAVEYEIDDTAMEVRQIWEYGRRYGSERYTPFIGDANYLANGNRLVCFGGITRNLQGEAMEIFDFEEGTINRMKISAVVAEVTGETPAREVMTIRLEDPDRNSYRGYRSYRAVRMPLYPAED